MLKTFDGRAWVIFYLLDHGHVAKVSELMRVLKAPLERVERLVDIMLSRGELRIFVRRGRRATVVELNH